MFGEHVKPEQTSQSLTHLGSNLILFNDDFNTFDYVIECLIKVCGHEAMQAEQCALVAHFNGKCPIMSGDEIKLQPFKVSLLDHGLSVEIQN